jgi:ankyrin repeat protein
MRAIQFHMVDQATAIISRGADVTAKTTYGATAMDLAAAEPAIQRQLQVANYNYKFEDYS